MTRHTLWSLGLVLAIPTLGCESSAGDEYAGEENDGEDTAGTGGSGDGGTQGDDSQGDDGGSEAGDSGGDEDSTDEGESGGESEGDADDTDDGEDTNGDSGSESDGEEESSDSADEDESGGTEDGEESGEDGGDGDDWVEGVEIAVHDQVNTVLVVTWNQVMEADEVWLEFSHDGEPVMTSRPRPGSAGAHQDVVLGVPGETEVTVRIVNSSGGTAYQTRDYQGTTLPVPSGMPVPTIVTYDAAGSSSERWMFGSVEDSSCNNGSCQYYQGVFWLYIMDRQGRIVWYYADPSSNISSAFQRVARDGEYILVDKGRLDNTSVVLMTLDHEYYEELEIEVGDCIDVTDDGLILHNSINRQNNWLMETDPETGNTRQIWNCDTQTIGWSSCYSNTVNWNPLDDTVVMSFPYVDTVAEIDRQSGEVVALYGTEGDYDFEPSSLGFEFNHFPTITPDGTLLVSSHMPGYPTENPVAGQHAFMEFTIDRQTQTLTQAWLYQDGPEWPRAKGMALRLDNGNTLANYGTGGTIREITPEMETVFHVKFDVTPQDGADQADFYNEMVNHNVFVDDLYALNQPPE